MAKDIEMAIAADASTLLNALGAASSSVAFERAQLFCRKQEGGYADVAGDRGGKTMAGVTHAEYDAWRTARGLELRPVSQITEDEIHAIYRGYWRAAMCDVVASAGLGKLALCLLDFAINSGDGTARKYLQEVVGVEQDKIIGPKTLAAIEALGEDETIKRYLARRALYCHRIIAHDPSQQQFHDNWMARIRANARECGVPIGATYEKGHTACVI